MRLIVVQSGVGIILVPYHGLGTTACVSERVIKNKFRPLRLQFNFLPYKCIVLAILKC